MPAYSFKKRFVAPIRIGLGKEVFDAALQADSVILRPKTQTIRAIGKRRHARPSEVVQLYCGMRTRQCFKIGDGRCTGVEQISIDVRENALPVRLCGEWMSDRALRDFARADGFEDERDMLAFWKAEHGIGNFAGVLIKWESIRG